MKLNITISKEEKDALIELHASWVKVFCLVEEMNKKEANKKAGERIVYYLRIASGTDDEDLHKEVFDQLDGLGIL